MEKMHIRKVVERFNLYDEETGRGVICVVSHDGTYEVIGSTSSTVGRTKDYDEVLDLCSDVSLDYYKYDYIKAKIRKINQIVAEISAGIEQR